MTCVHPHFRPNELMSLPRFYADVLRLFNRFHCSSCEKLITDPILCLICGKIYSKKRSEQKCCDARIRLVEQVNDGKLFSGLFSPQHRMNCANGLSLFLHVHSSKILIQEGDQYAYWSSLYLDEHGEEDAYLR